MGHSQTRNKQTVCWGGGQRGTTTAYDRSKEKKPLFINRCVFLTFLISFLLHCNSSSFHASFSFPSLPPELRNLVFLLTTYCYMSFNSHIVHFRLSTMIRASRKVSLPLFFINSPLIYPVSSNLCHAV